MTSAPAAAVLVPVKAFSEGKLRLAEALPPVARAELARSMAEGVLRAAGQLPAAVVCEDDEVASWADALGASVVWAPGLGLNGAVELGVQSLGRSGFAQVIVAHADLPLAADLRWVADFNGITLVPDRRRDGTNVICVPTTGGFRFAYGPSSFSRHRAEAERLQVPLRVVTEPLLAWDVDVPGDLTFSPGYRP